MRQNLIYAIDGGGLMGDPMIRVLDAFFKAKKWKKTRKKAWLNNDQAGWPNDLQIFSLTLFEKTTLDQLLKNTEIQESI